MSRYLSAVITLEVKCDAPFCNATHTISEKADSEYVGDPQGRVYIRMGELGWVIGTAQNIAYCPKHRKMGIPGFCVQCDAYHKSDEPHTVPA